MILFDGKRIKNVTRDDITGCETLSKVETLYLEVKRKEARYN